MMASSLLPASASLRWQGVSDDPVGIGVFQYQISRNGTLMTTIDEPDFADATVQPSTTYTYAIAAVDFHGNIGSAGTITVTTPPAGAVDPRRVGVVSTGSYWGGGGEQIDTLSGNLNFSLPMVTPQGRTGWKVPFGLTYNSQNWRQDNGVNWQLGNDVGYGFGWKLLAGSLTPYYTSYWTGVDHYVFTDSTGAEYRLDQNNGGIWSSRQGIYVWFDSNANKLHFKDGSFWVMGSTSGGTEQDAGTMYPTTMEDVNGNQILITYQAAVGWATSLANSSARPTFIEDTRAISTAWQTYYACTYIPTNPYCYVTYVFSYSSEPGSPIPHLTGITNLIGTSETYTLSYSPEASLAPPFGYDANWAGLTTTHLASMQVGGTYYGLGTWQFAYDSAGAGELNQVTFPYGGHLRWTYANDAYNGSRSLRAVSGRYLAADSAGATEWSYGISRDNASAATLHSTMSLTDASGNGSKTWNFITSTSVPAWQLGLVSQFLQKPSVSSSATFQDDQYVWSQDPAGHPYISQKTSIKDEGTANQQSALSQQTLDQYGNLTQSVVYPYNNSSTPLQTYNSTYLNSSTYTANYIFDRLSITTLTSSSGTRTVAYNYIDGANGQLPPSPTGCSGLYNSTPYTPYNYQPPTRRNRCQPDSVCQPRLVLSIGNDIDDDVHNYILLPWLPDADRRRNRLGQRRQRHQLFSSPDATTQSYSNNISYNGWLGMTSTTGLNGEQLSMNYDSMGRPSTGTSPYGATDTWTYAYPRFIAAVATENRPRRRDH